MNQKVGFDIKPLSKEGRSRMIQVQREKRCGEKAGEGLPLSAY